MPVRVPDGKEDWLDCGMQGGEWEKGYVNTCVVHTVRAELAYSSLRPLKGIASKDDCLYLYRRAASKVGHDTAVPRSPEKDWNHSVRAEETTHPG